MRVFSLLMLGFVALATAAAAPRDQPVLVDNNDLKNTGETRITNILEQIVDNVINSVREIIWNSLDPWLKEYLYLDLSHHGYPESHLALENVAGVGLGSFFVPVREVHITQIIPLRLSLYVKVVIPVIDIDVSNYEFDWNGLCIPIYGNGAVRLRIKNLTVTMSGTVAAVLSSNCISFEIVHLHAKVSIDTFELQITGLWHDEQVSSLLSSGISSITPKVLKVYEQEISAHISPWLEIELNKLLSGTTFKSFNGMSDVVDQKVANDQQVSIDQPGAIDQLGAIDEQAAREQRPA